MGGIDRIVDSARDFACYLYKNQPRALIPNAAEDLLRLFWDDLCGDPPSPPGNLPPPPKVPFDGGQCVGIEYRIEAVIQEEGTAANTIRQGGFYVVNSYFIKRGLNNRYELYVNCNNYLTPNGVGGDILITASFRPFVVNSFKVFRVDGRADNCGNPPKTYPPADPVPPGGFKSPPTAITLNDNDVINVTFNFVPPIAVSPPITPPQLVVNVESPKINIPITFDFDGDVNVGPPRLPPPAPFPPDIKDKIDQIDDKLDDINIDIDNLINITDDWLDPPPFDTTPEIDKTIDPIGDGKEDEQPGLLGIKVTLTKFPDKAQFGNPTVYFAGWIAFKSQGGYTPRKQVNFSESYFIAPPGATGYTVTLTNGAEGDLTVYSKGE